MKENSGKYADKKSQRKKKQKKKTNSKQQMKQICNFVKPVENQQSNYI